MAGYPHHHHHGAGRREFFIASEMNGKVLDIKGDKTAPGAEVLTYHKKSPPAKNQLWYTDPQGHIRSALNDLVFHNNTKGHGLKTENYTGDPRSQWRMDGNRILNGAGECLDIRGASNSDGAEVCAYEYKNQKNQHWTLEYV